ncbi:MAG: FAD-dependent oxidoreductase [Patescibacteria group bacterium]
MTNILILGAGFGGIAAALKLEKKLGRNSDFKITLSDRNNFHLFTPSLYEVATVYGLIEDNFNQYLRGSVAIPINEILKGKKVNFVQAEIKEINLEDKVVATGGGAKLSFDYLVIALGGETEFYGIPGVREYAYNLKSVDDAVAIYKKINDLYKTDKADRTYKIAIIGGGFTGVELAAELGCCVGKIIEEHKLSRTCTTISLFQADQNILPAVTEKARKTIEKRLKDEMVRIYINSLVKEVGPDYIKIGDGGGALNFDIVLWAGGIRGSRLLESLDLKLTKKNTIEINEFLQAKNSNESVNDKTFVIGDSAALIDSKNGRLVPAMAYVAFNQADAAAENIINHIKNHKLKAYKPFYDVWIAPAGGKWAYFHYKNFNIAGFWGYLLKQLVDFRYFFRILPLKKALALFFKDLVIFTKND